MDYLHQEKELYLATFGGGLNKLVSISKDGHGEFKSYSVLDGLPSDVLLSIREDSKQNLWISTENGICKFIPSEERFESYDERSITFPVRFSEAASALTAKGSMLSVLAAESLYLILTLFVRAAISRLSYSPN